MGHEAERKLTNINLYNEAKAFALSVEQNNVDVKYEQDEAQAEAPKPATPPTVKAKAVKLLKMSCHSNVGDF